MKKNRKDELIDHLGKVTQAWLNGYIEEDQFNYIRDKTMEALAEIDDSGGIVEHNNQRGGLVMTTTPVDPVIESFHDRFITESRKKQEDAMLKQFAIPPGTSNTNIDSSGTYLTREDLEKAKQVMKVGGYAIPKTMWPSPQIAHPPPRYLKDLPLKCEDCGESKFIIKLEHLHASHVDAKTRCVKCGTIKDFEILAALAKKIVCPKSGCGNYGNLNTLYYQGQQHYGQSSVFRYNFSCRHCGNNWMFLIRFDSIPLEEAIFDSIPLEEAIVVANYKEKANGKIAKSKPMYGGVKQHRKIKKKS